VLLAGDASHLFSPIGGLGMNTGFQDAANLGWKLGYALQNKINPEILNSYAIERRSNAVELLKSTDIATRLIARMDKNVNGIIQQWLPKIQNKILLKKTMAAKFFRIGASLFS
jgi:2-polyprenyl-6-methoxyphenol hydroxylase-like FAD-dependent oxidoreductase